MTSPAEVQRWMVAAITGAEIDAAHPEAFILPNARMTAEERLEIYRSGYRLRLVECLTDDYPVLTYALGDDADAVMRGYIERHPSTSPNLNFFGRHMASFCRETRDAFAAELATLEWSLIEVLHAEAAPPLDPSALAALPAEDWARARFVKSEAVRMFRFEHPVNRFYQSVRGNDETPPIPAAEPSAVVVYRKDHAVWRQELTPAMAQILEALLAGKTIGDALEPVEDTDGEVGKNLMAWFRDWTAAGLFLRVELV